MKTEIKLWETEIPYLLPDAETPNRMKLYLQETDRPLPCVVVLPGGGYRLRADHEGEPIALRFFNGGLNAAVVDYRVEPNRYPAPLADVQRAIRILRSRAEEWQIDPEKIIICGFSAGGHLACCSITLPEEAYLPADEIDTFSPRPNGAILSYALTSFEEWGHVISGERFLGDRFAVDAAKFDLCQYVNEQTPKTFLWHTSDDHIVNVKSSLYFAERLRENHVPFELHVFPQGRHGLGIKSNDPSIEKWPDLALQWIKNQF